MRYQVVGHDLIADCSDLKQRVMLFVAAVAMVVVREVQGGQGVVMHSSDVVGNQVRCCKTMLDHFILVSRTHFSGLAMYVMWSIIVQCEVSRRGSMA